MKIRLAEKSDMRCILDIFNYEVERSNATFSIRPRSLEERMEWFNEHNKGCYHLIVAEADGKAVGYASLSEYRNNDAYAHTVELSIYVDRRYRRQKAGECLMGEIIDMARRDERIHTIVSVITGGNEASIRLHKKFGFAYCGTIKEVGRKFGQWIDIDNFQLIV